MVTVMTCLWYIVSLAMPSIGEEVCSHASDGWKSEVQT